MTSSSGTWHEPGDPTPDTGWRDGSAAPSTTDGAEAISGAEISVGIDHISAVLPVEADRVQQYLAALLPDDTWFETGGGKSYQRQYRSRKHEAEVYFGGSRENVRIDLKGKFCAALTTSQSRSLLNFVRDNGGRFTWLDLRADDYSWIVTPADVQAAIDRKEHVTHARTVHHDEGLDGNEGHTVYIGSADPTTRQSLRIYNKNAESRGRINACRWELTTRDNVADRLAAQLVASDDWGATWAGALLGFIDFKVGKGRHRTRAPWFEALVGPSHRLRLHEPVDPRTIEEVAQWILNSVSASIYEVVAARGGDMGFYGEIHAAGKEKVERRGFRTIWPDEAKMEMSADQTPDGPVPENPTQSAAISVQHSGIEEGAPGELWHTPEGAELDALIDDLCATAGIQRSDLTKYDPSIFDPANIDPDNPDPRLYLRRSTRQVKSLVATAREIRARAKPP